MLITSKRPIQKQLVFEQSPKITFTWRISPYARFFLGCNLKVACLCASEHVQSSLTRKQPIKNKMVSTLLGDQCYNLIRHLVAYKFHNKLSSTQIRLEDETLNLGFCNKSCSAWKVSCCSNGSNNFQHLDILMKYINKYPRPHLSVFYFIDTMTK